MIDNIYKGEETNWPFSRVSTVKEQKNEHHESTTTTVILEQFQV